MFVKFHYFHIYKQVIFNDKKKIMYSLCNIIMKITLLYMYQGRQRTTKSWDQS